ncbi:MAG: glycosyltransferase family 9 protein [Bryobacteraceae bacterium]|jgi:heptosyltransferase-1
MSAAVTMPELRLLVVRLGAMGDVLHALPAVASLKASHPAARITWAIEPRWAPLLEANPYLDRVVTIARSSLASLRASWRELRSEPYHCAVDFQGLLKSALVAKLARPGRLFGFDRSQVRERAANLFYSDTVHSSAAHRVDQCLDLAAAVPGTNTRFRDFPLPAGRPEGELPAGDFVLASPVAGWRGKQWPLEFYAALAERLRCELNLPLVWNVPSAESVPAIGGVGLHVSSLAGLIWATRRATAIVGVDSGPMHLAAALSKPGVAIFGPTDPARNGPYQAGAGLRVLRDAGAVTSYQRGDTIDDSMRRISPDQVFETLRESLRFVA